MRFLKLLLCVVFFSLFAHFGFCDETEELRTELKALKARIIALENKLEKQEEKSAKYVEAQETLETIKSAFDGLTIGAGATFVVQATENANNNSNDGDSVTDASYSIDLEFEKEFADYAKGFIHLEAGGGEGVENELTVFSNVNRDADNDENVRLTEVWYEHYLKDLPITVTAGKIDATCYIDTNEYANDEAVQFLGRIFRNSPVIEFADNAAGVRFGLEPAEFMDTELVVMDADSDWEDVFEHIFLAGQVNFKPNLFGRGGNYRVIAWLNDREHTKWDDSTENKKEGFGFGLNFDQELTDNLGVFVRYGWQDPEQRLNGLDDDFSLEHSWSTGLQLSGNLWGRADDVLGLAIGQAIPSDDYKDADATRNAESEGHFEAYYSCKLNEHLTVSPDLQVIWNSYGDDATGGDDAIIVGGMRGQVDF